MGYEKDFLEKKGFKLQPDGTYAKRDPFTKQKVVWNEDKGNGERILQHPVSIKPENAAVTAASMIAKLSTDEDKLNKTEKARLAYLRMLDVPELNTQAITLKIANDCRFTADFTYVDENGRLTFEDVKGFQREDALIKIKVAARKFRIFRFLIVKRVKGGWELDEVKP